MITAIVTSKAKKDKTSNLSLNFKEKAVWIKLHQLANLDQKRSETTRSTDLKK